MKIVIYMDDYFHSPYITRLLLLEDETIEFTE